MDNDIVSNCVSLTQSKTICPALHLMFVQFLNQLYRYIHGSTATLCLRIFDHRLTIYHYTIMHNMDLVLLPINILPLQTKQFSTSQAKT